MRYACIWLIEFHSFIVGVEECDWKELTSNSRTVGVN